MDYFAHIQTQVLNSSCSQVNTTSRTSWAGFTPQYSINLSSKPDVKEVDVDTMAPNISMQCLSTPNSTLQLPQETKATTHPQPTGQAETIVVKHKMGAKNFMSSKEAKLGHAWYTRPKHTWPLHPPTSADAEQVLPQPYSE